MKFFIDTEFYEDGRTIELISIGVVAENGMLFYAETPDAAVLARKTEWLAENVYPGLSDGVAVSPRAEIANHLRLLMGDRPEIWAYYADYDWVALCQLFGRMMDLPEGWPMFCRDIKQWAVMLGDPKLPEQTGMAHNALADAMWNRKAWDFLSNLRYSPAIKTERAKP